MVADSPKLALLQKNAAWLQKGFNGERKLDYHIRSLSDAFAILNDVTLTTFRKQFQIDSLIITAHAIYIIEVKSYEGNVTFNTNLKQCIQANGEKLQGHKYPITQVENIHHHLLRWLQKRQLDSLPIYYFIAFSEQSTIINVVGDEDAISKVISYVDEIPLRLMTRDNEMAKFNSGNNNLKSRIISAVMRECEDFDYDVFKNFNLDAKEILPGIHCPECGTLGMNRIYGKWRCSKCGAHSKDAHKKAINDFVVLFGNTTTNQQSRDFLMIKSRHLAKRVLQDSNLVINKGTKKWMPNTNGFY